ncbi:MAG: response regulator [Lachnospiraceae bacterium]|nr:response regulator [Lachnospiraceae bacterium]
MDGMETIKQMRAREKKRSPVIAFTTETSLEDLARYQRAGIDDCLRKPADLMIFCRMMEKWL